MFPPKQPESMRPYYSANSSVNSGNLEIQDPESAWKAYFHSRIWIDDKRICCYLGGGDLTDPKLPLLICFHGAGHTGLSFALVAVSHRLRPLLYSAKKTLGKSYKVAAVDMRAHGLSRGSVEELDIETLVEDGVRVVDDLTKIASSDRNSVVLCGHSMGASVVARVGTRMQRLLAVVLLDASEGSALEALPVIESGFLSRLPTNGFRSLIDAVEWALGASVLRNRESAAISIPSQLQKLGDRWIWRVNLAATRPHWENWFRGMNNDFLACQSQRVLVMAGTSSRLDKQLMVAMMQGQYQFRSLKKTGHVLQEDQPEEIAKILSELASRHNSLPT